MAALIHLAFILIFNQYLTFQEPSFPQAVRMRRIAAGSGLIILMVSFKLIFLHCCLRIQTFGFLTIEFKTTSFIKLFSNNIFIYGSSSIGLQELENSFSII